MSAEHELTEARCEILEHEETIERLTAHNQSLREDLHEMDKENDTLLETIERLTESLESIVANTPANEHKKWPHHHFYLFTAREALAAVDKGDT